MIRTISDWRTDPRPDDLPDRPGSDGSVWTSVFLLGIVAILLVTLFGGCQTIDRACKRTFRVDKSGESLLSKNQPGADRISSSRENELVAASQGTNACGDSPWAQNVSLTPLPSGREETLWTAQRPNGGVLFPKTIPGSSGPVVVVAPKSIIAQVGSEVVLVASYVGPDREFLRVNEELQWGLDGDGHFLTTNPKNGCVYADYFKTKKISDRYLLTATTSRAWRIHRGTATVSDDISILRGQAWASIQSAQEGTSSVSVLAPNIDDWNSRTATAQIHWVDAAFYYPTSGISPIGQPATLTTTVYRKSSNEPRPGWIVRYEVISGPEAGFGPNVEPVIEIQTDEQGQGKTVFSQRQAVAGVNQIKIQIIRPTSGSLERVVVDEKTLSWNWSGDTVFNLQFEEIEKGKIGHRGVYRMNVTNLTGLAQDGVVRMTIPTGSSLAASQPSVSSVTGNTALWVLEGIPARSTTSIRFDLDVQTAGPIGFDARIDQKNGSTLPNTPPATGSSTGIAPPLPNVGSTTTTIPERTPPLDPQRLDENTASTQPQLSSPTTTESVSIQYIKEFPKTAAAGTEFEAVFAVQGTGSAKSANIAIILPEGVTYLQKDLTSGQVVNRLTSSATKPLEFERIEFGKSYPVWLVADAPGEKKIEIRVLDSNNRSRVLAESTSTVSITGGGNAVPSETASRPKADLKLNVQGDNAPNFLNGRDVAFTLTVQNNENYQLSGLKIVCAPESTRQGNPWTFVSSDPSGAQALSSGAYQVSVPVIPAGTEQKVTLTLKAQTDLAVGTFVADLMTAEGTAVAQVRSTYSISTVRQSKRPSETSDTTGTSETSETTGTSDTSETTETSDTTGTTGTSETSDTAETAETAEAAEDPHEAGGSDETIDKTSAPPDSPDSSNSSNSPAKIVSEPEKGGNF